MYRGYAGIVIQKYKEVNGGSSSKVRQENKIRRSADSMSRTVN
jgi:hypothetical protein